jgi:hypothetical protein
MAKAYCNSCDHKCHCKGSGFFSDSSECGCGCLDCTCKGVPLILTEEQTMIKWIKKQWQKFIDWVFDGFYK